MDRGAWWAVVHVVTESETTEVTDHTLEAIAAVIRPKKKKKMRARDRDKRHPRWRKEAKLSLFTNGMVLYRKPLSSHSSTINTNK